MKPAQFVHTLQLMDSLFPVGAFAYSDGLETAASQSLVHDSKSLAGWLDHYVHAVFTPCDGLALLKCWRALETGDWSVVRAINEELTALKPAAAVRASSSSVGKRLLAAYSALFAKNGEVTGALENLPRCNAAVAYGIAFSRFGLDVRESLLAFGYGRLSGMVSAALRLIPIGQQQGQAVLTESIDQLPGAVERILQNESEPLRSFAPILDIQQMNHRYVYSRLFRS
jgi:urease accessory protein